MTGASGMTGAIGTTGAAAAAAAVAPAGHEIDPGFTLAAEPGLRITARTTAQVGVEPARRWLAMQVARQPLDLRAHVQRIRLLADQHDALRLFGALVDLFLVLGDKGHGLREAMLHDVRAALDPDDHAFLSAHLAPGLTTAVPLPMPTGAVIAPGVMGASPLVREQQRPAPAPAAHDPYDDPFYVPPDRQG